MADVRYVTVALSDGVSVQVVEGTQLHDWYLALAARTSTVSAASPDIDLTTLRPMAWFMTPHGPQSVIEPATIAEFRRRDYAEITAQQAADFFAGAADIPDVSFVTGQELPAAMDAVAADPDSPFSVRQRAASVAAAATDIASAATGLGATARSLFQQRGSVGDRARRAAAAARRRNSIDLGAMATPPAITAGDASLDAALTVFTQTTTPAADLAKFRVSGGIPLTTFGVYRTAWAISRPSGTGGNTAGDGTHDSGEWAVEFMTDAPKFQVRMLGTAAYMVEVDDQPVSVATLATTGGGGTKFVLVDFTSAGGAKPRKIRLELKSATGVYGIDTAPTYTIWKPEAETNLRVALVGDSIVAATGATFPNGSWPNIAGKLLGWADVRPVAFGGTGLINNAGTLNTFGSAGRVADIVTHNPDMLIIPATQNDEASSSSAITAAALATFQAYRTALPNVPIVILGVDASSTGPSASRIAVETAVLAAFNTWADGNSWFVPETTDPSGSWFTGTGRVGATTGTGNRDRYGFDPAHPNDAGHLYLGRRVANAFRSLVLPYVP